MSRSTMIGWGSGTLAVFPRESVAQPFRARMNAFDKEFVLSSTLGGAPPGSDEDEALQELEAFIDERLKETEEKGVSKRTVEEIFEEGIADAQRGTDA